jgi:hypothetical protein
MLRSTAVHRSRAGSKQRCSWVEDLERWERPAANSTEAPGKNASLHVWHLRSPYVQGFFLMLLMSSSEAYRQSL